MDKAQIVELNKSRPRAKYWKPSDKGWLETGMLPADPTSVSYYFSKGFKGKKPDEVSVENSIKCPMCEFEAKNAFGLQAHFKKHLKKEDKI